MGSCNKSAGTTFDLVGFFSIVLLLAVIVPVAALRPLREAAHSWGDEVLFPCFMAGICCV